MTESRHSTIVEIRGDDRDLSMRLKAAQAQMDRLRLTAGSIGFGGGGGGGGHGGGVSGPPGADGRPGSSRAAPAGGGGGGGGGAPAGGGGAPVGPSGPPSSDGTPSGGGGGGGGGAAPSGGGGGGASGPPDSSGTTGRTGLRGEHQRNAALTRGLTTYATSAVNEVGQMANQGSSAPGAANVLVGGPGRLAGHALSAASQYMQHRSNQIIGRDPDAAARLQRTAFGVSTIGGVLGVMGGLAGSVAATRVSEMEGLARVNRDLGAASMGGQDFYARSAEDYRDPKRAFRDFLRTSVRAGYHPEEAASLYRGFIHTAGGPGAEMSVSDILRLNRSGISLGAAANYVGLRAPGAGGIGGNPAVAGGLANSEGLFGSKADEFLSIIAASTSNMAANGMRVDLSAMEHFMGRFRGAAPGLGLELPRIAGSMVSAAAGAKNEVFGSFAQIPQLAIMAEVMGSSSSLSDMSDTFDKFGRDPGKGYDAIRKHFGGDSDVMEAIASGLNLSRGARKAFARGLGGANMGKLSTYDPDEITQRLVGLEFEHNVSRVLPMATSGTMDSLERAVNVFRDVMQGILNTAIGGGAE